MTPIFHWEFKKIKYKINHFFGFKGKEDMVIQKKKKKKKLSFLYKNREFTFLLLFRMQNRIPNFYKTHLKPGNSTILTKNDFWNGLNSSYSSKLEI